MASTSHLPEGVNPPTEVDERALHGYLGLEHHFIRQSDAAEKEHAARDIQAIARGRAARRKHGRPSLSVAELLRPSIFELQQWGADVKVPPPPDAEEAAADAALPPDVLRRRHGEDAEAVIRQGKRALRHAKGALAAASR
eukprot:COSAG05_NODE_12308_length_473_cov_0.689840_1_plen_139_part_01